MRTNFDQPTDPYADCPCCRSCGEFLQYNERLDDNLCPDCDSEAFVVEDDEESSDFSHWVQETMDFGGC